MTQQQAQTVKHQQLKEAGKAVKDVVLALMGRKESAAEKQPQTIGGAIGEVVVKTAENAVYGLMAAINPMAAKQLEKSGYNNLSALVLPAVNRNEKLPEVAAKATRFVVDKDLVLPKALKSVRA